LKTYLVHPECKEIWDATFPPPSFDGDVCICGHPLEIHDRLCKAGATVCLCQDARAVARVSDTRYFFRSTKGPHEAHGLQLALSALSSAGGTFEKLQPWNCEVKECPTKGPALAVRMRGGYIPTLKLPVIDLHRFMCEDCLFKIQSTS